MAHGVPGIIAFLGKTYAAGIARDQARWLLDRAVTGMLQQRLPPEAGSSFPAFAVPGRQAGPCRLAWCYGDAGAAAALLLAARCAGVDSWEREALSIARRAASRDPLDCGVLDPGFCHGSAGLAHIFNRIHQATGDELLASASRYWLQHTLQFRTPGAGIAGYSVWRANPPAPAIWQSSSNIIEGASGIGLVLLAAIGTVEPNWDRIFMVDIPPVSDAPK
jgi:hypothetical protein